VTDAEYIYRLGEGELTADDMEALLNRCAECDDKVLAFLVAQRLVHDEVMYWENCKDRGQVLCSPAFRSLISHVKEVAVEATQLEQEECQRNKSVQS